MNEALLIKSVNKILKAPWSKKQLAYGKWIEVKWEWVGFIGKVVCLYKAKGWVVSKHVELSSEGRRVYLAFINPGTAAEDRPDVPFIPKIVLS
jgi:hypothetical protein